MNAKDEMTAEQAEEMAFQVEVISMLLKKYATSMEDCELLTMLALLERQSGKVAVYLANRTDIS